LLAGLLANEGFTASPEVLAHKDGGLFNSYSDGGAPEAVTAHLGERWELEQIALRLWPAASSIQKVITSLLALAQAHDLTPAKITSVRVGLSKTVYDMHGTLPWSDKFKALLSTPYVTSVVLHDRRCWLEHFEPRRYQDPAVGAFARERVEVEIDPRVEGTGAAVEIRTADGAVHTDRRAAPKGDPTDPLSRAEIEEKLRVAAAGFMSVKRILATVSDLENLRDTRELTAALRAA
jgi:2-methylcitrate dehydratase PrpD